MANTYTQLYVHLVFAVMGRASLISPKWKVDLYKYITGIVTNKQQKLMAINGMSDHIHILISTKPDCNLSDLVRDIKANSSKHINEQSWVNSRFEWQKGFGAFSVSSSQVDRTVKYIENQEKHHGRKTFKEEYIEFLNTYDVDFDERYIFE